MSTMWNHQVGSSYSTRLLTIKRTSKAGWKFRLCIDAAIYMNTGKGLFRIRLLTSLSFRCILGDFPVLVLRQANKDLKWQSTSVKMTMQSQKFLIPTSHLDFLLFSIDSIYNLSITAVKYHTDTNNKSIVNAKRQYKTVNVWSVTLHLNRWLNQV